MRARAARSGTRGLPPLGLGGSGGSKGFMNIHSSSGTRCFEIGQDPTAVSLSISAWGTLRLGLLRWRYRAQLLHQAHHVELSSKLHDLSVNDPVEDAAGHLDPPVRRSDSLQLALVRAPTGPSLRNPIPFRDQLLEGGMPVGERPAESTGETLQPVKIDQLSGWHVDLSVYSHQLVRGSRVPLVPELLDETPHQLLVLFHRHSGTSSSFASTDRLNGSAGDGRR